MISLRQRLNRGLTLILLGVFAVHWYAADWVIRTVAEKQMLTRLEHDGDSLVDTLLHPEASGLDFDHSRVPLVYDHAYSGHYFVIEIDDKKYESASLQQQTLDTLAIAQRQVSRYYLTGPKQQPLLVLGRGISKNGQSVTLTVAEDMTDIQQDILSIRQLYLGLTLVVLILAIVLQTYDVKRAMRPLKKVKQELGRIADGYQQQITCDVPAEIRPLVKEVNRLIVLIERRLQQSRTAIGNLAHALKTPLAVLVRLTEDEALLAQPRVNELLKGQTQTIHDRIDRELKHARLSGQIQSGAAFNPQLELQSLAGLLKNIYAEKQLIIDIHAPDRLVPFDRQDMLEMIGNLADNACKWATRRVNIRIDYLQQQLLLKVEDDGPGCEPELVQQLTSRGLRLDESVHGHGLGLSIVQDIVDFYGGRLALASHQTLGGLVVTICIG